MKHSKEPISFSIPCKVVSTILSVCLILSILLSAIYFNALNNGFYSKQYAKNNTDAVTKISLEDLDYITANLLDYLDNKRETLDMTVSIDGTVSEVFDSREKEHMVDVVKLFDLLKTVIITLLCIIVICVIYLLIFLRRQHKNQKIKIPAISYLAPLCKNFLFTSIAFYAVIIAAAITIYLNFNWFWTQFHLLLFTNDLWMLDPAISVMINMFPLEFFYQICTNIVVYFFVAMLSISTFSIFVAKYTKSKAQAISQI